MFCTSKERQTCDVEKRTCEGCYYNSMREEDIINQMQEFVDWIKANKDKVNKQEELLAILQGMLDLYQQEKEKNKELEKVIDLMAEDIPSDIISNACEKAKDLKLDCYADMYTDDSACRECIKEYYFKKARGGK